MIIVLIIFESLDYWLPTVYTSQLILKQNYYIQIKTIFFFLCVYKNYFRTHVLVKKDSKFFLNLALKV